MSENRLLIMDDDPDVATFFSHVGEGLGFEVSVLHDPARFFEVAESIDPNLLLLDLQMPGRDGIELLRELAQKKCKAAIYIASGLDRRVLTTAEQLGRSLGLNIAGSFCKPIPLEELQTLLANHKQQQKVLMLY